MSNELYDFTIRSLGPCKIPSPHIPGYFTDDGKRILFDIDLQVFEEMRERAEEPLSVEVAGPREKIYFDPAKTKAAIVTCGGLCPGLNDVIRAVVMQLFYRYHVRNILGIRYGLQGFIAKYGHDVIELTPDVVKDIHTIGGSILSSSRGSQDVEELVDSIYQLNINILFCIGGDGTMKAAELITEEIAKRQLNISIIGIPKTIDNDLNIIDKTFGFDTAISEAVKVIDCAHVEAKGAPNGIGLVKIMGRQSGHIAVSAALAQNDVNFVLIPEVPFDMDGEKGFLKMLENRLRTRHHALILVAEGAGQSLFDQTGPVLRDASGNVRLNDIGVLMKDRIEHYFARTDTEINLKYIDPSYTIRSVASNASDSLYCAVLGQCAVHAGMAGKTGMVVGLYRNEYVHLPIRAVTTRKKVDPDGNLWMRVLEATGQPPSMKNEV
ncbi:MAG: ATP-dependent 6-phosphofructokinase [Deltaproteobacteria bacterium]|nr:ATP-dependent 6-phosphofructokinase [Deltaproteobacteria bacterium]